MFKKPIYFLCAITLLLSSASVSLAQWSILNPEVVGGTLSERLVGGFTRISEDKIIMFGGRNGSTALNDTWLYSISDNRWTVLAPAIFGGTLSARYVMGFCNIGEDQVLMYGGYTGTANLNDTWLYDLSDNSWKKLSPSIVGGTLNARHGIALCDIGGGRALMFGGHNGSYLNETWMFDLNNNKWTKLTPTVTGGSLSIRYTSDLTYLGANKVLMFGGFDNTTYYNDTWIYDISTNVWAKQSPTFIGGSLSGEGGITLCSVGENKVVKFGGRYSSTSYGNETWSYDSNLNQWTKLNMSGADGVLTPRGYAGFFDISTNKAILFGGSNGSIRFNDTWLLRIPDQGADAIQHENLPTGVKLTWSWNLPANFTGITFFVYKNGQKISPAISQGTVDGDAITFTYTDETITSGTIGKYKISEVNSYTGIETMYPKEIVVPYCQ